MKDALIRIVEAFHKYNSIVYTEDETANPDDMLSYYTKEDIEKYGVVGIEISLIEQV